MLLTIITPTFNGAKTIHRCYESLCRQTFQDFYWIIVDDRSRDETSEIVLQWQREALLNIIYTQKPNGGKPSAVNHGVKIAKGEMCTILDSDDAVANQGLLTLVNAWNSLQPNLRDNYWCVVALCEDSQTKQIVGDLFPSDRMTATKGELQFKHKMCGERWSIMRTSLLKKNPYPEGNGYKYVPESYIWSRLGRQYNYFCLNTAVRTYFIPTSKTTDNLSGRANYIRNAEGFVLHEVDILNEDLQNWFTVAPLFFFKRAAQLSRYGIHSGSLPRHYANLNSIWGRILVLTSFPLGFAVYLADKLWFKYYYTPIKARLLKDSISL